MKSSITFQQCENSCFLRELCVCPPEGSQSLVKIYSVRCRLPACGSPAIINTRTHTR